jgi:hypothetical protein
MRTDHANKAVDATPETPCISSVKFQTKYPYNESTIAVNV